MRAYADERTTVGAPPNARVSAARLATWTPLAALSVLVVFAYAPYLGDYFVGGDTWAHIWTSRDVGHVLTQPIMAGSTFPETVARFYRPLSSLTYTLQYALWGLNPTAFHVGDLAIDVLAMLALASLGMSLGLRPWAAALGAAVVALHPLMASVVPAAPRRHDSLVTLGLCVGLALVVRYVQARGHAWRLLALSSVALACAELSKEPGFAGPLLVLPTMLAASLASGRWMDRSPVAVSIGSAHGLDRAVAAASPGVVSGLDRPAAAASVGPVRRLDRPAAAASPGLVSGLDRPAAAASLAPVRGPDRAVAAASDTSALAMDRSLVRRFGAVFLAWTAVSVVLFVWHAHVVAGLGGYGPLDPFTDLDVRVDELVLILLWPFRANLQTYLKAYLIEGGLVLLVAALPIAVLPRRPAAALALAWAWLLLSGGFQLMTESTAPWQTYLTLASVGLMIAAILDGAATVWLSPAPPAPHASSAAASVGLNPAPPAPHASSDAATVWLRAAAGAALVRRAVVVVSVAGVLVFTTAVVRDSVLLTPYPEWHAAGRVAQAYLAAIGPCIDSAPAGETVLLASWPVNVDDATDQFRLIVAGVFAQYSAAPAVYLTMNHPGLTVLAQKSEVSVGPTNRGISATCADQDGSWLVNAVYDPAG